MCIYIHISIYESTLKLACGDAVGDPRPARVGGGGHVHAKAVLLVVLFWFFGGGFVRACLCGG